MVNVVKNAKFLVLYYSYKYWWHNYMNFTVKSQCHFTKFSVMLVCLKKYFMIIILVYTCIRLACVGLSGVGVAKL